LDDGMITDDESGKIRSRQLFCYPRNNMEEFKKSRKFELV
jgi:hypothetical protein